MIITAEKVEAGSRIEADLLIIGAGAAGITIARQFIGTPYRIVVLESGGESHDDAVQALYEGTTRGVPTEDLDVSRLRYFGGTTNHWAGWCRPLDSWDFEAHPDWPESGWPISRDTLDPYYSQAAKVCQLGPFSFDDAAFWQGQPGGEALQALPVDPARLRTALFQISPPTRFAEAYGAELEAAPNVQVILNASALELLPSDEGESSEGHKRIGSVRAATLSDHNFTVAGRATVVAMGGIETARLLLLSDKVHKAGAGNEYDLVGRYFLDHPWIENSSYLRFSEEGLNLPLYYDETEVAGTTMFGVLAPTAELARREGIGGFRLWLRPSRISTLGSDSVRAIVGSLRQGEIADDLGGHIGNILGDSDILIDNVYKTVTGSRKGLFTGSSDAAAPIKGVEIDLNFEQRPNRDSRVLLGEKFDAFGQRKVVLDWRLTDTDRQTAQRALELAAHEFGRMGLGRMRIRLDVGSGGAWPSGMIGSRHHSGTTRMAKDPRNGVVDADCRVHSVDNLFIASSAVFSTAGYANPTLTIVALALRLSQHLQKVLA